MKAVLPYGKETVVFDIEDARVRGVLRSRIESYVPDAAEEELVERALRNPIGSAPLCELARGKHRVTVIASDHTRPVPSRILMPRLLREIRRGNPDAQITVLVATGCHRGTTLRELTEKFGEQIVRNEHIVVHDCDDTENLVHLGTLPSGGECRISRFAADADLLAAEGFIEPHFFAGFSGGRKSVLPGVAGRKSVLANHCAEFIADPHARTGNLTGNPIHRDMVWAAKQAGLRFILNVVLNCEKRVIRAFAGDPAYAHEAGCGFLDAQCGVAPVPADIVITSNGGYPLDQNIYQAVKGMTAAEACVNRGGVIIMAAKSEDGHGGDAFCREMSASDDLDVLSRGILARGRNATQPDQWQAQILIRVLQKAHVIYMSDADDELVRSLHMIPAHSPQEAMALAGRLLGRDDASVTVIPDGVAVTVRQSADAPPVN